jgi:hypothetical protein
MSLVIHMVDTTLGSSFTVYRTSMFHSFRVWSVPYGRANQACHVIRCHINSRYEGRDLDKINASFWRGEDVELLTGPYLGHCDHFLTVGGKGDPHDGGAVTPDVAPRVEIESKV